jgi:hypothetical protein
MLDIALGVVAGWYLHKRLDMLDKALAITKPPVNPNLSVISPFQNPQAPGCWKVGGLKRYD